MNISVVIIAKNEADAIADCIASVSFAKEVIVIDAQSTDATRDIATKLGAKVITHPWQGYGEQKNFGASHATENWILFLDADERVSPELAQQIKTMPEESPHAVYWITIEDIFLGKHMEHLKGHNPRLVQRGKAKWSNKKVHEQLIYADTGTFLAYKDGISGDINQPIIHSSYKTVAAYLTKMHRYTSLDAQDMHERGIHRSGRKVQKSFFTPYVLAFRQLIKLLFYRKGILDGWQGITWCALSSYYEFEMGMKYVNFSPLPRGSERGSAS